MAILFRKHERLSNLAQNSVKRYILQLLSLIHILRPLLDDIIAKISLKTSKRVEFTTVYHRCEMVYADAFCLREVLRCV